MMVNTALLSEADEYCRRLNNEIDEDKEIIVRSVAPEGAEAYLRLLEEEEGLLKKIRQAIKGLGEIEALKEVL